MLAPQPVQFTRRSPLYGWHVDAGAEFVLLGEAAHPERYPGPRGDSTICALADLCLLPRFGAKGWEAWSTLATIGVARPDRNNTAWRLSGGGVAMRLGDNEAFLLGAISGDAAEVQRAEALPSAPGFYPVPRRDTHAWLLLIGAEVPKLLSKVCAVDFRFDRFADLTVAQTMVARVGAVVLRDDIAGKPAFHVLADSASARYLWDVLLDAAEEYSGRAIGYEALRRLTGRCPADRVTTDGDMR
jgi:sarcosine oxidase, subunit gamma